MEKRSGLKAVDVLYLFSKSQVKFRRGTARLPARSSDDGWGNLVFDEGDTIAQLQFALLEPLQAQQIRCGRLMQRIDRRVQIAMRLLQPGKLGVQFALILVGHGST